MSVDLTVTEEDVQQDESAPTLREGYIGPASLVNLERAELGDTPVLRFEFRCEDVDHRGQTFEHVEWEPRQDDLENKDANGSNNVEIQLRRLVHILSRVLDTDQDTIRKKVVRLKGDTLADAWDSLRDSVVAAYEQFGTTDEDVRVKAFARPSDDGYVNVQFGRYPGFIRVVGQDPALEFTQWERQRNAEAEEALNSEPDSSDDFGGGDEDDFDYDYDDTDF